MPHRSSAFAVVGGGNVRTGRTTTSSAAAAARATATTMATATTLFKQLAGNDDEERLDIPPAEEYTGSVDWDAEWKKVVKSEGKLSGGKERPGSSFYKSEAEIAAIKTANAASKKVAEATSTVSNALPDIRSLSGDWKFWIGILALVSIGLSVLTAPQNVPTGYVLKGHVRHLRRVMCPSDCMTDILKLSSD